MSKILVAMSGGVDSSVCLKLLIDEGHELCGATFVTDDSEESLKGAADARDVAEKFGIPHHVINIADEFKSAVKDYFVRTYEAGATPNPCVICNREIKFGLLLRYAEKLGYPEIATGHYARLDKTGGRCRLMRAADVSKDQTYMLALVPEEALRKSHFPLGDYTKAEIRAMAAEMGISTADKKDSQDICFIPDGDYVKFLTEYRSHAPVCGKYISADGTVLGEHMGQECYTIGQRKGLGIALGRHVFVLEKNAANNTVTLGDADGLFKDTVTVDSMNLIGRSSIVDGEELDVKIRYAHRAARAKVFHTEDGKLEVKFAEPQRAPSPGQFAVLYDGDEAVGGGMIV